MVGAGPVGLVAALRLAGYGIPVTVIEREADVSRDLRASTFHPPTLDMLAPYGVTSELIPMGLLAPTWQVRMHATGEKAEFDLSLIADETDHPYRLQCEQGNLVRLLADLLAGDPLVDFRFGAELTGLSQDADGVTAMLRRDGAEDRVRGPYLIGADGAASATRTLLGLAMEGATYPETTVLASTRFRFHDHIDGLSNVNYCWAADGNFALLRLPNLWRCSLYYPPGLPTEQALADDRIQAQLHDIYPSEEPFDIVDKRPYRVHQRIVADYRAGRVLLAGDAAHLNSPSGGMGMNGGIHDAFNLTEKLAEVWRGGDPALLDRYTRQRKPIAERQILQQADGNRRRMTEKDPAKRRAALAELQKTAENPAKARPYLLKTSMIEGLREAAAIP